MKDTCFFEKCGFAKNLFDTPNECPNYIETWWNPSNENKPVLIRDCAYRRIFLMIQDLSNRLVGVQKAQEHQRNENVWVQVVAEVLGKNSGIDLSRFVKERQILENVEKIKQIEETKKEQ